MKADAMTFISLVFEVWRNKNVVLESKLDWSSALTDGKRFAEGGEGAVSTIQIVKVYCNLCLPLNLPRKMSTMVVISLAYSPLLGPNSLLCRETAWWRENSMTSYRIFFAGCFSHRPIAQYSC